AVVFLGSNDFQRTHKGRPEPLPCRRAQPCSKSHSDERIALGGQHLDADKNDILAFSPSCKLDALAACERDRFGDRRLRVGHFASSHRLIVSVISCRFSRYGGDPRAKFRSAAGESRSTNSLGHSAAPPIRDSKCFSFSVFRPPRLRLAIDAMIDVE